MLPAAVGARRRGECVVCREDNVVLQRCSSICQHPPNVCAACFRKHVNESLNVKGHPEVTCPSCNKKITDTETALSTAERDRLNELLTQAYIRNQPDFRWYLNPGCGFGQIHEGGDDSNVMHCGKCDHIQCFTCHVSMHFEMTCAEFQAHRRAELNDAELATDDVVQKTCKPCPRCRVQVFKDDGCDHMTCKPPGGCGHEYCWLCLAPFEPIRADGNHRHRATCLHYRAIAP